MHGVYLQDWLSDAAVRNWRLDPAQSGASTTFADLGTHWCDLAMHLSGRRIESVCAAMASRHGRPIDDHAGVLFTVRAAVRSGRSSHRRSRRGRRTAFGFASMDRRDRCTGIRSAPRSCGSGARAGRPSCATSQPVNSTSARERRAHLPAGEIEGWNTTFVNLFASVYRRILGLPDSRGRARGDASDGLFLMRVIEAVTRSSAERAWVDVEP